MEVDPFTNLDPVYIELDPKLPQMFTIKSTRE